MRSLIRLANVNGWQMLMQPCRAIDHTQHEHFMLVLRLSSRLRRAFGSVGLSWKLGMALQPKWTRWEAQIIHRSVRIVVQVLAAAVEACPLAPQLWLISAKQKWLRGDVDGARAILQQAAQAVGSSSEDVHLAAAKIEVLCRRVGDLGERV